MQAESREPDFALARKKAYELLIYQKKMDMMFDVTELCFPGKAIYYCTTRNYAKITGVRGKDMTLNGKLKDGFTVKFSTSEYIVVYDANCRDPRVINWTIAHELGHIELGHVLDGPTEQVEAHFFAACLLMADAIIRVIAKVTKSNIDAARLFKTFNVSHLAACKKVESLSRYGGIPATPLDKQILSVFEESIGRYFWPDIPFFVNDVYPPKEYWDGFYSGIYY